jgi:XTP/dITP diphosphohydrolase
MLRTEAFQLFVGTKNLGKLSELKALLASMPVDVLSPQNFPDIGVPEETGSSLEENALIKARYYHAASGLPTLAEDSGLEVEALDGLPGAYSARFAGPSATDAENVQALLQALRGETRRQARFRTVVALIISPDKLFVFEGEVRGRIAYQPQGRFGFGYDPVFIPEGSDRTFAQMLPEEKNALSHRRRAMEKILMALERLILGSNILNPK